MGIVDWSQDRYTCQPVPLLSVEGALDTPIGTTQILEGCEGQTDLVHLCFFRIVPGESQKLQFAY